MGKQNKIREWESKRDYLNDKLDLCEEKLRNQKQDQRPEDSKQLLAAAKVRFHCFKTSLFIWALEMPINLIVLKWNETKSWICNINCAPREWALIRGGRLFECGSLFNFHHSRQVVSWFCNKTWRYSKREDTPKQNLNCSLIFSLH